MLIKYAEIPGLPDVGGDTCDQPERIVIEAASDCHVAAFRERLILMISTAVRELRVGYVDYPLAGSFRYKVYESEKILTGIAESHAAPETAFIVAGRPAHIEGDHALILIPDVDGPVELFVPGRYPADRKEIFPVDSQCVQSGIELIVSAEQ